MLGRFFTTTTLILATLLCVSLPGGRARADSWVAGPSTTEHVLQTPDGLQHFSVIREINANGEVQVRVEHEEFRALVPGHTESAVLYGRDLDNDGKIDAWFYPGDAGVLQAVQRDSEDDDGWDAASQILLSNKQFYKDRWLVGVLLHSVLSSITLTVSSGDRLAKSLVSQELDLLDLDVRSDRLAKESLKSREDHILLMQLYSMSADGWGSLSQQIKTQGIRDRYLYGAADIILYVLTAGIAKGLTEIGGWVLPRAIASAPGEWALKAYTKLANGFSDAAAAASRRLWQQAARFGLSSERIESLNQAIRLPIASEAMRAIGESIQERISLSIEGLMSRQQVAAIFASSAQALKAVAKGALTQWKYVASTEALELGIEIYERRDTLFSPNPLVFAKRIVTDKDLMEDVGFMSWDGTLATGVSAADSNVKRRMVICGVLSFVDSKGVSMLVRQPDKVRNSIDTTWEMTVGNAETQIDLKALSFFESMAERSDNPKLKLLGYAAAFIDDGTGYWAYEKVTNHYESVKAKDAAEGKPTGYFSWIPIFGQS